MNEKRLIDVNAYIREHCKNCDWLKHGSCPHPQDNVVMCYAVKLANEAPTIDAVEVVHGRWIMGVDEADYDFGVCSVCGFAEREHIPCLYIPRYCPNCGAKMDGERRNLE